MTVNDAFKDRIRGTLLGMCVGDALAMPVHWYYHAENLKKDYGTIDCMMAPKPNHPERYVVCNI